MSAARDANIALPPEAHGAVDPWPGWERWLRGHLDRELKALLATERRKFETKTLALEFEIAKLSGAVDVLRGATRSWAMLQPLVGFQHAKRRIAATL